MRKVLIISLLAFAGSYGIATAQQPAEAKSDTTGWQKIGVTTVEFQKMSGEILVPGSDKFASIKFLTTDVPVNLMDLEVYYETGDKQDIKVAMSVNAQGESQEIELNGGERKLTKVVFAIKALADRTDEKAVIELWGLKPKPEVK